MSNRSHVQSPEPAASFQPLPTDVNFYPVEPEVVLLTKSVCPLYDNIFMSCEFIWLPPCILDYELHKGDTPAHIFKVISEMLRKVLGLW